MDDRIKVDEFGLIVQGDGDGGDTAQRTGFYYFARSFREDYREIIDYLELRQAICLLEVRPGIWKRHFNQWTDEDDFSRDQQMPLIIAMGAWGITGPIVDTLWIHLARLGKYQNNDYASPEHWGMYVRALRWKPGYPIVVLGDLFMLLNSIILIVKSRDPDNVGDDLNHCMSLVQSYYWMPTPISYLARKTYVKFRRKNFGNILLGEKNAVMGALSWYFRKSSGASPLNEIWRPLVERILS